MTDRELRMLPMPSMQSGMNARCLSGAMLQFF